MRIKTEIVQLAMKNRRSLADINNSSLCKSAVNEFLVHGFVGTAPVTLKFLATNISSKLLSTERKRIRRKNSTDTLRRMGHASVY